MLENPLSSDQTCTVTRAAESESSQTINSASSSGEPIPGSGYRRAIGGNLQILVAEGCAQVFGLAAGDN